MGHVSFTPQQTGFRVRLDVNGLASTTWDYAENTNATIEAGVVFRVRFLIQETAGGDSGNNDLNLPVYVSKNSGAYQLVTSSSADAQIALSSQFADGDAISTSQLSGTGTYAGGNALEAGGDDHTNDLVVLANQYAEFEVALLLVDADVADGDTFEFRLHASNDSAFSTTYTSPVITASKPINGTMGTLAQDDNTVTTTFDGTVLVDGAMGALAQDDNTVTTTFDGTVQWPDLDGTLSATAEGDSVTTTFDGTIIDGVVPGDMQAITAEGDVASTFSGTVPIDGVLAVTAESDTGTGFTSQLEGDLVATAEGDTASFEAQAIIGGGLTATQDENVLVFTELPTTEGTYITDEMNYTIGTANFKINSFEASTRTIGTAKMYDYLRIDTDSFAWSSVRSNVRTQTFNEAFAISGEDLSRDMTQQIDEALGFAETVVDLVAWLNVFSESFGITDSRKGDFTKQIDAALGITESDSKDVDRTEQVLLNIVEVGTLQSGFYKQYNEVFGISSGDEREYTHMHAETFGISEDITKEMQQEISEAVAFVEAIERVASYNREVAEALSILETSGRELIQQFDETFGVANTQLKRAIAVYHALKVKNSELTQEEFEEAMRVGSLPGYTDFKPFVEGDYEYQKALFRIFFTRTSSSLPTVNDLKLVVDVPDVLDSGVETLPAAWTTVSFNRQFTVAPEVTVTLKGGATLATPKLSDNIDANGFEVALLDSGGSPVAGSISWSAKGY